MLTKSLLPVAGAAVNGGIALVLGAPSGAVLGLALVGAWVGAQIMRRSVR
jgi:hypothetical protein